MNHDGGAPPQVIRRADGSFHVLNVDLDTLNDTQRIAVGTQIWDQIRAMLEASGEFRPLQKQGWANKPGVGRMSDIDGYTAKAVGVSRSRINLIRPRLSKRPDMLARALRGEFESGHELARALGYKLRVTLEEGAESKAKFTSSYFGKGDKFAEVIEPLARYLSAWEKKDFRYTHVPPKEAQRRISKIDQLIAGLTRTKEDLAGRSHVASYAVPSARREKGS